jgi:myo-inositol-1-phosphate synthase
VTSRVAGQLAPRDVHIGPSDHVPWLDDRKWAYIRIEGTGFGGAPVSMELKLEVWDSPNSAGVVIDAIRCAKLGLERGLAGPLDAPSSAFMKSPPEQLSDWVAHERLKAFVAGTTGASAAEEPRFG